MSEAEFLACPLFPDGVGSIVDKRNFVSIFSAVAESFGLPTTVASGAPVFGGHCLRRGGAQYYAAAGVDVWKIQCLARHSSQAIARYLDNALETTTSDLPNLAAHGKDLKAVREQISHLRVPCG